jgi:hypothetical protein
MGLLIYPYFLLKTTQSKDVCELISIGNIFSKSFQLDKQQNVFVSVVSARKA